GAQSRRQSIPRAAESGAPMSGKGVRGAFITIEGIEGVGKTSSLAAIERFLVRKGVRVVVTREPGGTAFGERLREVLLHGGHEEPIAPEAEALLMFAARAQHLARV